MKLCKIGDKIYGLSLQQPRKSYLEGFPQREVFLIENLKNAKLTTEVDDCDAIWIDNPMYYDETVVKLNKPVIFDAIDWYEEMCIKENRLDNLLKLHKGLEMLKQCQQLMLISQSPLVQGYMEYILKLPTIVSEVIPNGYDEKLHTFTEFDNNEKKIMLFAGKMGRWYSNLIYFIEFVKNRKDWEFRLLGDGELKSYFEKMSNGNNIIFYGHVSREKVAEEIKKSDVCVFPVDDCSPIVVSEYMACGRPVVNLGTRLNWLVRDAREGFCLSSPDELTRWLEISYLNKASFGFSASEQIKPYSWRQNAIRFEEALRRFLN